VSELPLEEKRLQVIPVIDVRHGVVVRAIAGDRANYQPIVSPLFEGSAPHAAISGLMALYRFPVIYIADLDAIEGRGGNVSLLGALADSHPGVGLWVDAGARTTSDVARQLSLSNISAVIGSETGVTANEMRELKSQFGDTIILSLDFRGSGFVGEPELLADPTAWPNRVIAMTLANVGMGQGPDIATLASIKQRHPGGLIYAAGGIRNAADLQAGSQAGAHGALVSSAVHAQTITADDLGKVTGRHS
jgi:uncharacterized protein related to proFAR isomerase